MTESQTGCFGPERDDTPREARLSGPDSVLLNLGVSALLWVLLAIGLQRL